MSEDEHVAVRVLIGGRVQGVAFRWNARARARELSVGGWVRNLADGRVEAHVEGLRPAVDAMLAWLERGPRAARVEACDSRPVSLEGTNAFEVRRGE